MKRDSGCCAVDIYCTAALTSLSDSVSYITFLFSEWRISGRNAQCVVIFHPRVQPETEKTGSSRSNSLSADSRDVFPLGEHIARVYTQATAVTANITLELGGH